MDTFKPKYEEAEILEVCVSESGRHRRKETERTTETKRPFLYKREVKTIRRKQKKVCLVRCRKNTTTVTVSKAYLMVLKLSNGSLSGSSQVGI